MVAELSVDFMAWRQANATTLKRFYELLRETPILQPEKLGPYQPFEYEFESISAETFASIAIDERFLLTRGGKSHPQGIYFSNVQNAKKANIFAHDIEGVETRSRAAETFLRYAPQLFKLFEPVYGRVYCKEDYRRKNLVSGPVAENAVGNDLRNHLPGIYWANFFGPRYIEFFGEDRLMSAPAHEVRWLGDAGILLLVSESPFDYEKPDVKETEQAVVEHLGPEAFFFKSDPDDKTYRQPDLSDLPQFALETNGSR